MGTNDLNQWTIKTLVVNAPIGPWVESFLIDRKAQNLAKGTLYFYQKKMKLFLAYCDAQVITNIDQIKPDTIRRFLLHLEDTGHNPGGIHAAFRALRTFLYWWEAENEPDGWKNPIRKVKAPRVPDEQIEPVELAIIQKLIDVCKGSHFTAVRDRALFYFLLDTGARAAEICALDLADVDQMTGAALIRQGKGRKPRTVHLAQKARRAFRQYARARPAGSGAAWLTDEGDRLTYWGLNEIIGRRSAVAGVAKPGLHDFRRAFAINFLRNGGDIYSLQELMGHADLQILKRYLKQTDQDLQTAHAKASPVDNSNLRG